MIDVAQKSEAATARRRAFELQLKQAVRQDIAPGGSEMGLAVGQTQQEQSYRHFRNWPYAIFNLIAKRVASQPIHAGEIVGASPNPETRSLRGKILKNQLPSRIYQKALVDKDLELLPDHPVIDSLCRPNPLQKKFEFLYFSACNLFLTGECYWVGGVSEKESRVELWAIPSSWVQPIHKKGLFSEYKITPSGVVEGFTLPAENVSRTYLADPSDPKGSFSPMHGVMPAVRTDDYIQTSQQQMFEQGLNPNVIVTIAAERAMDGGTAHRAVLTGPQRRQITRAIREMWSRQVNSGEPAILDGLIESIHKLNLTPQEMDWINSSELVKRRIFQSTGLNEITAGQVIGANRAQAAEAERSSCQNAINPIIDALSESMTDFLGPMFDSPERLVVWIEPCEPMDVELRDKRWQFALTNSAVKRGEYRVNVLGLEAGEDVVERNALLSSHAGLQAATGTLTQVGQGMVTPESAKELFKLFFEIDDKLADAIVGEGPPVPPPVEPVPEEPEDVIDEDAPDDVDEVAEETQAGIVHKETCEALAVISASVQGTLDAIHDRN